MCKGHEGCMFPEFLKNLPEECTPEQITQCHGDDEGHPCVRGEESG